MFTTLTYREWDALCTKIEHALAHDIPQAWPHSDTSRVGLMDELLDVHGDLMERPTIHVPTVPPADPTHPPTRLIRAIFGHCPDCDETRDHYHYCNVCSVKSSDFVLCVHNDWSTTPILIV